MKKTIYTILVLIVIAIIWFLYQIRPLETPPPMQNDTTATTGQGGTGSVAGTSVGVNGQPLATSSIATQVYRIDQGNSKVTYTLGEELNGKPFTVVGTTNSVVGQVTLNTQNAESSGFGTIRIDARTFKTDSSKRDSAVVRLILKSDKAENNYISFTPKLVTGAPQSITVGNEYSFRVSGPLTISGVEKTISFDVKAKMTNENTIVGQADTVIARDAFSLQIPNIPFVANVDQNVKLHFDFVLGK
jgi:polyisoprenoid-binding protein YceI